MINQLKEQVLAGYQELQTLGLGPARFLNISAIDRHSGLVVVCPADGRGHSLLYSDLVVVDMDGELVEGIHAPVADVKTYLVLYKAFKKINSIVHFHSQWATSWAQAGRSIPCYGDTHAHGFSGDIPATRRMMETEIMQGFEYNSGGIIVNTFKGLDYTTLPGVLSTNHGAYTWGTTCEDAIDHAMLLEESAQIAYQTEFLMQTDMHASFALMQRNQNNADKNISTNGHRSTQLHLLTASTALA